MQRNQNSYKNVNKNYYLVFFGKCFHRTTIKQQICGIWNHPNLKWSFVFNTFVITPSVIFHLLRISIKCNRLSKYLHSVQIMTHSFEAKLKIIYTVCFEYDIGQSSAWSDFANQTKIGNWWELMRTSSLIHGWNKDNFISVYTTLVKEFPK